MIDHTAEKDRPWWRMHPSAWVGIILIAATSFCLSMGLLSPGLLLHCLDLRYWPTWLIYPLWGAVCWRILDLPCWSTSDRRIGSRLKPALVLLILLSIAWHNGWYTVRARRHFFYHIYWPFLVGPMSRYMTDGYWDWKIFVLPTAGIMALVFLISLMIRLRMKGDKAHDLTERKRD